MAKVTAKMVSSLRTRTGISMIDCKNALSEADGDEEKAIELLKKRGIVKAAKKAERDASEGCVQSYIHMGGKVGVMLELNCESDFVAKNEDFQRIAKDICMHIAAAFPTPIAVNRDDVSEDVIAKEKEVALAQAEGKPAAAQEKIVEGKLSKFLSTVCLMEQPYVKNTDQTVGEMLTEQIQRLGENIRVRRFVRYTIGD